ncbi:MAG: hypothetical protein HYT43_00205 [Candidatus Taylorbacteria bacterium]|nr:hypothetical protein [Candidatus Taylorbacteria bacterium]
MQKTEASPAALQVIAKHHRKILFSLGEKEIRRAQIKKCEENFLAGWRALASGGGAASISRGSAQKKFGFRPKGTAIQDFASEERMPRGAFRAARHPL